MSRPLRCWWGYHQWRQLDIGRECVRCGEFSLYWPYREFGRKYQR